MRWRPRGEAASRNGKTGVTRRRKASGLNEIAGLPNEGLSMQGSLRFYFFASLAVSLLYVIEFIGSVGRVLRYRFEAKTASTWLK